MNFAHEFIVTGGIARDPFRASDRIRRMPYWQELRVQALSETKNYWTPIVAGILWYIFKPWQDWSSILQIACISLLGFFAMWGLVFFVAMARAPKQLDNRKKQEISAIATRLADETRKRESLEESIAVPKISSFEQEQRESAVEKLKDWTEDEKRILKHLLQHEQQDRSDLTRFCGSLIPADSAMNKGKVAGLIQHIHTHGSAISYRITPSFVEALKFYFHGA